MHFRHRGNNVQIVRSVAAEGGKKKSVPVGSINKANLKITDKLRGECTQQEIKEIEAWVTRYAAQEQLKNQVAALTLAEQMSKAVAWLEKADPKVAADVINDISDAMPLLRKALISKA